MIGFFVISNIVGYLMPNSFNTYVPIPAGPPHYLNILKPLMASDSSSGFSHLWPGVFHISLQIRKAQSRGWKKRTNEQTQTWVSSKRKKWGSLCETFCTFCVSVSKRERVLEQKLSQSH